ncbi:MAG: restriction endonuclease, partial [Chloroflexi bacterium]|nr:restriction endonuclease [Chloroflexota bacterium]
MAEISQDTQFPEHWIVMTLGELLTGRGQSLNPSAFPDTMFELYSVPSFDENHPEIISGSEIGSNKQYVEEGMVLLCKINPRINRVWVVGNFSEHEKIASTEWITFPQISGVVPKYLAYYMSQDSFAGFLSLNASGVGGSLMRVKPSTVTSYPFPL